MKAFDNILAVSQSDADIVTLLEKLQALCGARKVDISLLRVVYEGVADLNSRHIDKEYDLKELVLEATRASLVEAVDAANVKLDGLTSAAIWNARTWEGIIHAASSTDAQLIVKTTDPDSTFAGLRTPDDFSLLRHAEVPVLLTHPKPWPKEPKVVAAIDIYDPAHAELNDRILATAHDFSEQLNAELHLASVFPVLSNWLDEVTTIQSYNKLRKEIENEIFDGLRTLAEEQNIEHFHSHALEGLAAEAMHQLVTSVEADILVLGTKARKGVAGLLLGNTAEKLVHHVDADILTVS